MVAYNFSAEFADDVEARRKRQTIRRERRANPGDPIQLYTGQRTKACRKLGKDEVCKSAHDIELQNLGILKDGKPLHAFEIQQFARDDGFQSYGHMKIWFVEKYGALPFKGVLTKW